jgi:hypothetical protein
MTDLSPAAQAVLDAFSKYPLHGDHIAEMLMHGALPAALRAAADQVFTRQRLQTLASKGGEPYVLMTWAKDQFDAIAAELEAQ